MGQATSSTKPSPSTRVLFVTSIALVTSLIIFFSIPLIHSAAPFADSQSRSLPWRPTTLADTISPYAYVTLLSIDESHDEHHNIDSDGYFVAIRILAYQLLHAKETRSSNVPFVVLAVRGTNEEKKERLRRDGAIVVDIEPIEVPEWVHGGGVDSPIWANIFDKLRIWELTQFERVAFLDADHIIMQPMDGVFDVALLQKSNFNETTNHATKEEVALPSEYVFTAGLEVNLAHHFPPTLEGGDLIYNKEYVNAGFFVVKPSREVFDYYLAVLHTPDSFNRKYAEQDMLNYIHRQDGPMPWQRIDPIWNIHRPTLEDINAGVRSLHQKWWEAWNTDLTAIMLSWRWRMQGYFDALDASRQY